MPTPPANTPPRPPVPAPADPRPDWYRIEAKAGDKTADLWIYDDIGWWGTTAKRFAQQLADLDVDQITLHLNSPGGDAWDGVAIYNSLRDHKATVTVVVDGMAASAASVIAMAGDTIRMNRGAQMMIHDAAGIVIGNAQDMRDFAEALDKTSDSLAAVYAAQAGGTVAEWRAAMRAETWYTAAEAVAAGLADELVDDPEGGKAAAKAMAGFDLSRFRFAGREKAPTPTIPAARRSEPVTAAEAARRIHAAAQKKTPGADPASGPSTTPRGAAEMQFTDEERTALRARFGLAADADDDAIKAALLAPPTAPPDDNTPEPAAPPKPKATADGQMVIDRDAWDRQQQQIRELQAAEKRRRQEERDAVIAQAVKDGKFAAARAEHYAKAWDADPDGTRDLIAGLAKNVVPVAEIGYAGGGEGDALDAEFAEFDALYPPHMRLAGKGA